MITNAKIVGSQIDPEAYHRQTAKRGEAEYVMGRTDICEFARCPHRWREGFKEDDTKSTEWGTLMDCLVLDDGRFHGKFAVAPATYPDAKTFEPKAWNWNANVCKEWREDHKDKIIVKDSLLHDAHAASLILHADTRIAGLLKDSKKQVMVVAAFHDAETGISVPLKTLIDILPSTKPKALADFKTGVSADPDGWPFVIDKYGLHVQASLYLDVYNLATGDKRNEFYHAIQESYAPYETSLELLSDEFLVLGRDFYNNALRWYCRCIAANDWPGYIARGKTVIDGAILAEPTAQMVLRNSTPRQIESVDTGLDRIFGIPTRTPVTYAQGPE